MSTGTKISKNQLKAIVKECLVEILQEGLGAGLPAQNFLYQQQPVYEARNIRPSAQKIPSNKPQQRISPLDMPATPYAARNVSQSLAHAIKTESHGNPIMAEILADTAVTTLPKMMSGGDPMTESSHTGASRLTQQEQFAGTPEQVFGEDVASKWANLAFAEPPSKKLM